MPRKHKMSIGTPHDNCIDIFTHDLSLEAVLDDGGQLQGFNLLAGGGLGSTHGKAETFPRLADRIGFLRPDQALPVLEAATAIYRDYGDRTNRRHARLKYVLEERGVQWFRDELAARLGAPLAAPADAQRYAMACPAMPTCGLAVAESERYLPDMIGELEQRGYGNDRVWIRMSGCPNACSRPPTAEIGLVGRSLNMYNVYVGGSFEGTRLA